MQKGGGMDIFNDGCQRNMGIARISAGTCAQQEHERTQPLSPLCKQVFGDGGDQARFRAGLGFDLCQDGMEISANGPD